MKLLKKLKYIFLLAFSLNALVIWAQEFDVPNNFGDYRMHYWRARWDSHADAPPYGYPARGENPPVELNWCEGGLLPIDDEQFSDIEFVNFVLKPI